MRARRFEARAVAALKAPAAATAALKATLYSGRACVNIIRSTARSL
jgi:hypothetical protein